MLITVWEYLCNHILIAGERDRILIEKFSAGNPSSKLYEVAFTAGDFELFSDRTVIPSSRGSKELQALISRTLRHNAGCRTIITRFDATPPKRKMGQLYVDSRGLVHRDPDEGPAYWFHNFAGANYSFYIWHGLHHRIGKPAVIRTEEGRLSQQIWFRFGREHRDLNEGAAYTDQERPYRFHRTYSMHGHPYHSPKRGGQRKHTDEEYGESFPRGGSITRQEPAVSWLREKYRMLRPYSEAEREGAEKSPELPFVLRPSLGKILSLD